MSLANRRLDFSAIADPGWRLVAKELVLAMLAPRHPAVATLPRAYRTPLHLRSCIGRLEEAIRFFGWLRQRGISDLAQIGTQDCEAYLAFRRYLTGEDGTVVGEQSPSVRRAAAQVVVSPINYRELFTATRVRAACARGAGRPPRRWPRCRRGGPRTRPSRSPGRSSVPRRPWGSSSRCSPPRCTW